MAKITRIVARIFGSGAGIDQISKFGSLFAGSPAFTTDPAQAQSLSNWLTGWAAAAIGGNSPAIEDMNAAFFVLAYQIAYQMQAGVPEWNTDTVYYIGSLANVGGVLYVSLTNDNTGNLVTDTANWKRYGVFVPVSTAKTSTGTISANESFIPCNAGSAGFTLTLPPSAGSTGQVLYFKKIDSSSNIITIAGDGSDQIDGTSSITLTIPNEATTLICNGSGAWSIL